MTSPAIQPAAASADVLRLVESALQRPSKPTGYTGSWQQGYQEWSGLLAKRIGIISKRVPDDLAADLTSVARFYLSRVQDPEMGTFDQGSQAAATDVAIAVLTVIRNHLGDHPEIDRLMNEHLFQS